MSDIRFNQWLHQSGTGGVSQDHIGNIGIGTTNPSIVVSAANTAVLNVGVITANNLFVNNAFNGDITGNVTGNISGATGTFSGNVDIADKIIHTGDTDTAMRFPADNTFAVDTAGSERFRITSAGLIGIGTVSPSGPIHAHAASGTQRSYLEASASHSFLRLKSGSTSYNSGLEFFSGASNIANVNGLGAGGLQFEVNGSEKLRIDSTGRVGINTDTFPDARDSLIVAPPSGQTDVFFTLKTLSTNGNTRLQFADPDDTNVGDISYTHSNNAMVFKTADTERVRINSVGNMGIGGAPLPTTTGYDGATLHLYQSAGTGGSALRMTNGNTGHTTSDGFYMGFWDDGHLYFYNQEAGHIIFGTNGTDRGRITSTGNFGINTTNPATKLDVRPTAEDPTTGSPAAGAFSQIRADDATVGKGPSLSLMNLSGSKETGWRLSALTASGNNGDFTIHGYNGGATYEERVRITASGELLIGETSSGGACKLGMSFGNATGNYIEMGGTSRTANGLSKLAVMRHGYWGGNREVGSIGFLTSSSGGGAGRGMGNFVVHTGTSGNGDGGNSGDNLSIERTRVDSAGLFYVNTVSANNWSQTSGSSNSDHNNSGNQVSGNMCFRTSEGALVLTNDADSGYSAVYINKFEWNSGDDNRWINFYLNGSGKDSITWNGSNIVYGNNSDYRIKTNIRSYTGGIDLVKQIQVRQYDYIETERGTDHVGFIAHELQEVIPDAVSGEKDAMRTEEETGNEVMDIQNVDYGRVTPILTAALKEAIAKIETLEARITALEG